MPHIKRLFRGLTRRCAVTLSSTAACLLLLSAVPPHDGARESIHETRTLTLPPPAPDTTDFAPFVEPDFPFITATLDAGSRSGFVPERNLVVRGLILRLGEGIYACFDPDLLRMSVVWTGAFMSMGTMAQVSYDRPTYKDNVIPKVLGTPIVATGMIAGWSPETLTLADPRTPGPNPSDLGRGPLPDTIGRWLGIYVDSHRVALSYRVGGLDILEYPGYLKTDGETAFTRTFEVESSDRQLSLIAAEVRDAQLHRSEADLVVVTHGASDSVTAIAIDGAPSDAGLSLEDGRYVVFTLPAGEVSRRWRLAAWTGPSGRLDSFLAMRRQSVKVGDESRSRGKESREGASRGGIMQNEPWSDIRQGLSDIGRRRLDIRQGGRARWRESVVTQVEIAPDTSAYVFDRLALPIPNPWKRNVRVADVDFFDDGRAAVVTFDGDVWLISGVGYAPDSDTDNGPAESITWTRFASGLYEPLSLSIVDGEIFVFGREGIVRLHDLNGDGEADFYESFSDRIIQSTESREWAMDMVPRPGGGFYVAKGAALDAGPRTSDPVMSGFRTGSRHGGAVLEVSPDGQDVRVFASGFRQPFLGIHPETGVLTASDQQGNFVPATPIYVVEEGGYYGVPASAHTDDALPGALRMGESKPPPARTDEPMPPPARADEPLPPHEPLPPPPRMGEPLPPPAPPLTWIPHSADPSAAGQTWVTSDRLGPLSGALIHFSYGRPGLFRVYVDSTGGGGVQGGVSPLPGAREIPAMKGAVHPHDGLLYVAGFQIWQSMAADVSGLVRMRYTGLPSEAPTRVHAGEQGIVLRFDSELDADAAQLPSSYRMRQWNYRRSEEYGSGHFRSDGAPGEEVLRIAAAYLSGDRKAVLLIAPGLDTLMQVRVDFDLETATGERLQNAVYASIHEMRMLDLAGHGFPDVPWRRAAADFADTVTASETSTRAAEATAVFGRHLFHEIGCAGCHSIETDAPPGIAPSLAGLMDTERRLADGRSIVADSAYVVRSILNPPADVVEGYPANMPSYRGVLGDVEVHSLLLFIRSLSESGGGDRDEDGG